MSRQIPESNQWGFRNHRPSERILFTDVTAHRGGAHQTPKPGRSDRWGKAAKDFAKSGNLKLDAPSENLPRNSGWGGGVGSDGGAS